MWTTIAHITPSNAATSLRRAGLAALLVLAAMMATGAMPAAASARTEMEVGVRQHRAAEPDRREWQMVQRADVLPLETVLGIARREIGGGELLEVDLNDRTGVYRLKMLRANDAVVVVIVDGKTGRVLDVRGR
ncbi:hypothetical protein GTQ45_06505 [Pyruvatibacter mobilis]|jgi:uncharacterized membrane protein YkoI|uniref:PepSY domain-containing protein n=1 Tax=Pyruvatibacter mobilis TaxID=1712261 RepID=A0A845QB59_9HYPH|nr:PepSY domain-containing protein [Pyruvatibacter mobilis]NBG95380.1 hypothetical protein [Pyruvatibacter mobilis]QJD75526.1 PepSY domain-containing protein [Pyruvatibacter mobilis]GGD16369.1 hypothetical protein GCM10011587_20780 [Pyruvatibacter mobilis]